MKILQVLPTLSAGGAEGFVTNLGVSLAELGAEVRFFLMAGVRGERGSLLRERLARAGIEVQGSKQRNVRSPSILFGLAHLIHSWRPDVVQANLYPAEVATAAAAVLSARRGVCYTRRLANTKMDASRPTWLPQRLARAFPLTIACSPAVAEAYEHFIDGYCSGQIVTIINGAHLAETASTPQVQVDARRSLGISNGAFVVCHIGRIWGGKKGLASGAKAQDVLLKAFACAFVEDVSCRLVIVGDGPFRADAELLAAKLGIAQQVQFIGEQPEPWPALNAADMFCLPSRHEGLPNVLVEAASSGLPVVASDIPEINSLNPGDAWSLQPVDDVVRFAQAMRRVYEHRDEYAGKARSAAQGFRERFSMKTCAQRYLDAYAWLLDRAQAYDGCVEPKDDDRMGSK